MVHGDDFIIVSRDDGRQRTLKLLGDNFEYKSDTAGPRADMKKEIRVLGRILSCTADGWTMEADPNLIENAVCKLGLEDAKGVTSPGVKKEDGQSACDIRSRRNNPILLDDPDAMWPGRDTSPLLDYEHTKLYQSVGALLNFVAMDRPDLLYSVKKSCAICLNLLSMT